MTPVDISAAAVERATFEAAPAPVAYVEADSVERAEMAAPSTVSETVEA